MRTFLFILSALFLSSIQTVSAGEVNKVERLNEIISHYTEHRHFSGSVYARWSPTETFMGSGGFANDATSTRNQASTRFLIASISKTYLAAAILKLEEMGRLSVHDPLAQHLPEYPRQNLIGANGTIVTLHHVLSHTAGLPSHFDEESGLADRFFREAISFRDIIDSVKSRPLKFSPGTEYSYSNTGYILLGEIIRRKSGRPTFDEFLRQELLAPLNITETQVNWPSTNFARSYTLTGRGRRDILTYEGVTDAHVDDVFTDGNIFATAADVGKFFEALTTGRVLTPATYTRMTTPVLNQYGYGVVSDRDSEGRAFVMHNGEWVGFKAYAISYTELGATMIYLMNQELPAEVETDFRSEIRDVILRP